MVAECGFSAKAITCLGFRVVIGFDASYWILFEYNISSQILCLLSTLCISHHHRNPLSTL
jgi:hypothetical protein